jgi:1-acyl-sn-glycerol-3-phosphate acyltransferase
MTAYAPASACGHGCLPKPGTVPQVGWPMRVFRLAAIVLVLLAGVAVALAQSVLSPVGRGRIKRTWFRCLLAASGVSLTVTGDTRLSTGQGLKLGTGLGTLVVANHVSWLDIPAVLAVEGMRVVAKSDVRSWPVLGPMAARGGTVFIDRGNLRRLPDTVAEIAAALRAGQSELVFPEGSTWCGRTQGRFYPATFQAAIDAVAPVRAVSLRYRLADATPTTVAAFLGADTLLASVLRVVATRGLVVELDAGPVADSRGAARHSMATATAALVRPSTFTHPTGITPHPTTAHPTASLSAPRPTAPQPQPTAQRSSI